jgi:alkylation response protein AidB-like acyl-CoA dehydrogenase
MSSAPDVEDVDSFGQRARAWLAANMPRRTGVLRATRQYHSDEEELADVARNRELQRMLFDGGFAGICFPVEYGGQGLTFAHQKALNEELRDYECPSRIQVPTFTPCAAILLEFGTDDQKQRHIPAILRGDEIWMQFLSEPSGGSDVAGAQTTAVRDGDEWVLNGSKIWTTGAWWSDWALCLARTNWDVPKHRGLSVFMVKIHQPGIEVHRIEMLNGSREFCQEFLTDVRIPDTDRIGDIDEGWTVGVRWMFHERTVGGESPYVSRPARPEASLPGLSGPDLLGLARESGTIADVRVRDMIGEAHSLRLVHAALVERLGEGVRTRALSEQAAVMGRLFGGTARVRIATIGLALAGTSAAAWSGKDAQFGDLGVEYLARQAACIGGGTTEMARNVISERVLGMPREQSPDRGVPFREVPKSPPKR